MSTSRHSNLWWAVMSYRSQRRGAWNFSRRAAWRTFWRVLRGGPNA